MLTYWYDLTNQISKCQIFQASHSGLFVLSPQTFKNAIDRAAQYINSNSMKIECLYARAIASYALVLADIHSMSGVSLYEKIKKQAQVVGKILFGTLLTKTPAQFLTQYDPFVHTSHIFREPSHNSFLAGVQTRQGFIKTQSRDSKVRGNYYLRPA